MARKTVKIEIPESKPDDFITLLERIIEKHEDDVSKSPLDDAEVKQLKDIVTAAKKTRLKSQKLKEESEAEMEKAKMQLGIGKGQTSQTPGTGYFLVTKFRDVLLPKFKGTEEELSNWGFKVVIGTAKSPVRKPKS